MRNSRVTHSKPDEPGDPPIRGTEPEAPATTSQHKFKILKKQFILNKPLFRETIKRENQTSHSLTRKLNTLVNKETTSTQYLVSLKKAYDDISQLSFKKEVHTRTLKEEVAKMKRDLEYNNQNKENERECLRRAEGEYQSAKFREEQSVTEAKTLEHVIERMRQDQSVMGAKIKGLEKHLKGVKEEIRMGEKRKLELTELQHISQSMTKQILDIHTQKQEEREENREYYATRFRQLKQMEAKEKEKQRITQEIQTLAASDWNDSNVQKWKKLLCVEITLRKMLKFKIKNLERKYQRDKDAFHKIRIKTQLQDPKAIAMGLDRMGATTLSLYKDVEVLEAREMELQKCKQRLNREYEAVVEEQGDMVEREESSDEEEVLLLRKKVKESSERWFQIELLQQRIHRWWLQNSAKFKAGSQKPPADIPTPSSSQLGEYLIEFCEQLMARDKQIREESRYSSVNLQQLKSLENTVLGIKRDNRDQEEISAEERRTRHRI